MIKLKINGKIYDNFSSYSINLKYNSVADSFRFDGLRDVLPEQLSYEKCEIFKDDKLLITGIIVTHNYATSPTPTLISFSGYSVAGILEDCNVPTNLYPLQFDNVSLKHICDKILPTFGINYTYNKLISKDFLTSYKKINANLNSRIKDFINSAASQKSIIMTHTEKGDLYFTRYLPTAKSVYNFEEGKSDIYNLTLSTNGQAIHSEITVVKQASGLDKSHGQATVTNSLVRKYRPLVKISSSGDTFGLDKAARVERSNELAKIRFTIETKTFIKPGQLVKLKAPSLNLNNFVELFVEETSMRGNKSSERFVLSCVLKEVYTMEDPKNIFK